VEKEGKRDAGENECGVSPTNEPIQGNDVTRVRAWLGGGVKMNAESVQQTKISLEKERKESGRAARADFLVHMLINY
jgi:hypothetical protein